jgi:hypothetical protein
MIKGFILATGALALVACSPISQNSLLTNQATQPSSHAVSLTPTEDELYVKADVPTVYNATGVNRVDISGECFPSTFPNHAIYVYYNGAKQPVVDISAAATVGNAAKCRHGRFNLSVITASYGTGSYAMQVQVVGINSSGAEAVNVSRGISKFSITKY